MKDRICLAIETSDAFLGLALVRFSPRSRPIPLKSFFEKKPFQQSDLLFPKLSHLMRATRLTHKDIDLIAVNIGPGSFTGVRVGVASARALAQGLNKPIIGISGLEAIAYQSWLQREGDSYVSCLPALSGEVYFAVYQSRNITNNWDFPLRKEKEPCWTGINDFSKFLINFSRTKRSRSQAKIYLVGNRAEAIKSHLRLKSKIAWLGTDISPHPKAIAELAISRYLLGKKSFSFKTVVPLYLQPSWAERKNK